MTVDQTADASGAPGAARALDPEGREPGGRTRPEVTGAASSGGAAPAAPATEQEEYQAFPELSMFGVSVLVDSVHAPGRMDPD